MPSKPMKLRSAGGKAVKELAMLAIDQPDVYYF